MFARNSTSLSREAALSFGWKVSKTPSCVSSVSRELRSQPYSPAQKKLLPPATRSTSSVFVSRVRQQRVGVVVEVVADRADDADLVEERRGEREVRGGAADHPLASAERRRDGVEGDASRLP